MKKLVMSVIASLAVFASLSVKAADEVVVSERLFNPGEVGVTLSSGWIVNPRDTVQTVKVGSISECCERDCKPTVKTASVRKDGDRSINLTAGAFWFPTRVLGFEANVPLYSSQEICVQEVQAGLLLRAPLFNSCPVLRHVSPYAGLGAVYNWEQSDRWSYVAKGGLEVRLNKHWGVFGEYQYRNVDFHLDQGSKRVQAGLHLVF